MARSSMNGSAGMSPRKAMAGGDAGGNFGVEGIEDHQNHGSMHPDAKMSHDPLEDHERGIGHGIHHSKDMHAAQAAPDHGPTHPGGHMKSEHHRHGKG